MKKQDKKFYPKYIKEVGKIRIVGVRWKMNKQEIDAVILHDIITDHELCQTQKEELEKAIDQLTPKKINKSSFNVAFCPMCHGAVWQLRHESKYCFRCGQALDWSVEE
jgi:hypothetical protein